MFLLRLLGIHTSAPSIEPAEAYARTKSKSLVIIDVRQPEEWSETGRPAGSYGIPLKGGEMVKDIQQIAERHPKLPIALSCLRGTRSDQAARMLRDNGVTELFIVEGGIVRWKKEGLPVDTDV